MNYLNKKNIIITIICLVVLLVVIGVIKKYTSVSQPPNTLDEHRILEEMSSTGPSTLTKEERERFTKDMSSTGGSTISDEEMAKIIESMSSQ